MPLPPGPSTHPLVQTMRWVKDPFVVMDECQARYGDAFTLRMAAFREFREGLVLVSDPEVVKALFALGPHDGHAGKAKAVLKPFVGEHSVLLLDGSEHVRQRKMMLPAFHGERMHAYGKAMIELANASIDRWPLDRAFPVHGKMQEITLEVIVRTVFGIEAGPRFTELADVLRRALDATAWPGLVFRFMQRDFGRFSPWGRFVRPMSRASDILRAEIRAARAAPEREMSARSDVLAMFIAARDEAGQPLTEDEIHDELVTLLVAGHETTATALAWALRWILPDEALVARLREEIETADGDPGRIAKLELLDATVKEALRLQPVVPVVGRFLQMPMRLGGLELPMGAAVAASVYLVNRRASLYPDPQRFRPERFFSFKPAHWEWIPFGGGLRRCIGAAFATYEMKLVLASVLSRVDARLAQSDVRPAWRSVTVWPAGGLPILVSARRPWVWQERANAA